MRLPSFLSDLPFTTDKETSCDATVLHECRHCGSKFGEKRDRCTVCDSTEMATYFFREDTNSSPENG